MWKYKNGQFVSIGDKVLVSKKWATEHNNGKREATVCGLQGFITVQLEDQSKVDFDLRSITFVSKKETNESDDLD